MESEMADETTDTTTETTAPAEPEVPATTPEHVPAETAPAEQTPADPVATAPAAAEPETPAAPAASETPAAPAAPTADDVPDVTPDGIKQWLIAAFSRAGKTAAQAAIAAFGTATVMSDVDWRVIGSTALLAAILSLLTSIAGVPEVADHASVAAIRKEAKVSNGLGKPARR